LEVQLKTKTDNGYPESTLAKRKDSSTLIQGSTSSLAKKIKSLCLFYKVTDTLQSLTTPSYF